MINKKHVKHESKSVINLCCLVKPMLVSQDVKPESLSTKSVKTSSGALGIFPCINLLIKLKKLFIYIHVYMNSR